MPEPTEHDENETEQNFEPVISFGGAVKALGEGRVGGYLVRFSTPEDPDLTGEFFDAKTDYGEASESAVYYSHGADAKLGKKKLGKATLRQDEFGVWAEAQLLLRDEYEKFIYSRSELGKMAWSSGTASHLVEYEPAGKARRIATWPLGLDASLTPTPAEPRNTVIPLKGYLGELQPMQMPELPQGPQGAGDARPDEAKADAIKSTNLSEGVKKMAEETQTSQPVAPPIDVAAIAREAADAAVKAFAASLPARDKAGYNVQVTEDRADRVLKGNPFKSFGEMAMAVTRDNRTVDERLLPLRGADGYEIPGSLLAVKVATGLGEALGAIGGFLVGTDRSQKPAEHTWGAGSILSRISLDTISANSNGMTYYAENETSRVLGARHGGVRGYWVNEGTPKTPSAPAFRAMELRLKKVVALVYATDELLADAQALQSYLLRVYPDELTFLVENAIINGLGAGLPQGILVSPALVTVAIEAGQLNTTFVAENAIRMWARRYTGVNDYVWLINQDVLPQLYMMELPAGGGGSLVFMPPGGISGNQYATLFGKPVIEVEHCSTLGTLGDVILCSLSQYQGIQKGGTESASSIHFVFDHDETVFRFVYRFDGQSLWNSAVTPASGSANTVSPFVALAGRP